MSRVVVEHSFDEALSDEQHSRFARRLDPCLDARDSMWRRSYLSSDRKRMICEFEAPDAESVRQALRMAQVPFDRVWASEVFAVEDYPELHAKLQALLDRTRG